MQMCKLCSPTCPNQTFIESAARSHNEEYFSSDPPFLIDSFRSMVVCVRALPDWPLFLNLMKEAFFPISSFSASSLLFIVLIIHFKLNLKLQPKTILPEGCKRFWLVIGSPWGTQRHQLVPHIQYIQDGFVSTQGKSWTVVGKHNKLAVRCR